MSGRSGRPSAGCRLLGCDAGEWEVRRRAEGLASGEKGRLRNAVCDGNGALWAVEPWLRDRSGGLEVEAYGGRRSRLAAYHHAMSGSGAGQRCLMLPPHHWFSIVQTVWFACASTDPSPSR